MKKIDDVTFLGWPQLGEGVRRKLREGVVYVSDSNSKTIKDRMII